MLPSSQWFSFDGAILSTKFNKNQKMITIFDGARQVHHIDLSSFEIVKSMVLYQRSLEPFNYYVCSGLLSDTTKLFFWPGDSSVGYYIETAPSPTPKFYFKHHHSPVSAAAFSHEGEFLISGDEKGRTVIANVHFGTIEMMLPPVPDSISVAVFSPDASKVCTACFDGAIHTYKAMTGEQVSVIETHGVVESIAFLDECKILVAMRDGHILLGDIAQGEILSKGRLLGQVWPTKIVLSSSKKFAYIGTRESRLFVLHVNSLESMCEVDMKAGGITTLEHSSEFLAVGFASGELVIMRHREYSDEFSQEIALGNIEMANTYFERNVFLMTHKATRKIYDQWLVIKPSIQIYFAEGKVSEAESLARSFLFHPKFRKEMEQMEMDQSLLGTLMRFIKSRNFDKAYELCEHTPSLKESVYYDKMEHSWNKLFDEAKRLLARDPVLNRGKAKSVLEPFMSVPSKKVLVEHMISNAGVFRRAKTMVMNKNFEGYYKLLEKYPYLKKDDLHHKVEHVCEQLKLKMAELIQNEYFVEALRVGSVLEQFASGISFSKRKQTLIKSMVTLGVYLDEQKIDKACALVCEYELGHVHLPTMQRYHEALKVLISKIERSIENGEKNIFEKIQRLEANRETQKMQKFLIKKLYLYQISQAIDKAYDNVDWSQTLMDYLVYFPADKMLIDVLKKASLEGLLTDISGVQKVEKPPFKETVIHYVSS